MDTTTDDKTRFPKRARKEDKTYEQFINHGDKLALDTSSSGSMNASTLVSLLLNSLSSEALQHPSSWPKQTALDICLEAVDLLKSQMKREGYISFLPSWIKNSDFVKQYEEDFPEEEVLKLDNQERIFELPAELDEHSVVKVMDNIRYFGVCDDALLIKRIYSFYVDTLNHHHVESQKENFPELKVLWDNVDFTIQTGVDSRYLALRAASQNLLLALQHAHESGCPWDEDTCWYAAECGHLDCLKYAHENGCPWDENTCSEAAAGNYFDCLKYAHENGCPWDPTTPNAAAREGHLECLKYAHENGCPWDENTCCNAAEGGHLSCLKYTHENGCGWDRFTCSSAADEGHLDCLKYAHENGCPWDDYTCSSAAGGGHLDCLKYAHENGCPWNENTCAEASRKGHLDCLKYAHENGCPWNENTCTHAAFGGHLDCFQYAYENGCPTKHSLDSGTDVLLKLYRENS